jgi:hypothetical protein
MPKERESVSVRAVEKMPLRWILWPLIRSRQWGLLKRRVMARGVLLKATIRGKQFFKSLTALR